MLKITNAETGIAFNVRCDSENGQEAVRFFDSRYVNARWPHGQPVSSYYAETFQEIAPGVGLLLAGECPAQWYLTASNVRDVQAFLRSPSARMAAAAPEMYACAVALLEAEKSLPLNIMDPRVAAFLDARDKLRAELVNAGSGQ